MNKIEPRVPIKIYMFPHANEQGDAATLQNMNLVVSIGIDNVACCILAKPGSEDEAQDMYQAWREVGPLVMGKLMDGQH